MLSQQIILFIIITSLKYVYLGTSKVVMMNSVVLCTSANAIFEKFVKGLTHFHCRYGNFQLKQTSDIFENFKNNLPLTD